MLNEFSSFYSTDYIFKNRIMHISNKLHNTEKYHSESNELTDLYHRVMTYFSH